MEEFFIAIALFAIKLVVFIFVFAILIAFFIFLIAATSFKAKSEGKSPKIVLKKFNAALKNYQPIAYSKLLTSKGFKAWLKDHKIKLKKESKESRNKIFVLDFKGDIAAEQTNFLRKEVSLLLDLLTKDDQVLIRLQSPGGSVIGYGQSAAELLRLKNNGTKLTIAIDKIAASGGYLMSCVANEIIAAPFAIVGSIGVVAMVPNFYNLLKKNDIDFDIYTAGKYKRTVTLFGKKTKAGEEKFNEDLQNTHKLFKSFVIENRPQLDLEKVSTGEWWYAKDGLELKLVDNLMTSEEYLVGKAKEFDIFELSYIEKSSVFKQTAIGLSYVVRKVLRDFSKTGTNDFNEVS